MPIATATKRKKLELKTKIMERFAGVKRKRIFVDSLVKQKQILTQI
jgi:hypothetical protein